MFRVTFRIDFRRQVQNKAPHVGYHAPDTSLLKLLNTLKLNEPS